MKLYDGGVEPEPRRVRIFLAEKGVSVPIEPGDGDEAGAGAPSPRLPMLELDDGTVITESMAICRYFEGLRPEPPLFGRPGKEQALVEMWNRRVEVNLYAAVSTGFRQLHPDVLQSEEVMPIAAFLEWLDAELHDRLFIVSDHYSVADITALVAIDLMETTSLGVPDNLVNLRRWHAQVSARPSAGA
jgi:glutathione S-transferase